jgi:protein-tyrosine phosphatase
MDLEGLKAYLKGRRNPMSEIIPGKLYLGNWEDAFKARFDGRVTHIVNVAKEVPNFHKCTSDILYLHLSLTDVPEQQIFPYFQVIVPFIENAIENDGVVLVHCVAGMSRSASFVLAYLMKRFGWTLNESLEFVTEKRSIVKPNSGFIEHLKLYEQQLANEKEFDSLSK